MDWDHPGDVVLGKVFGTRAGVAEQYAAALAGSGLERGLIGPREVPRLWGRHVLNCAVLSEVVPPGASVVDVGSGAGLPGLVLAVVRPDVTVTLVEPLLRRVTWLTETVDALGLAHVEILRCRADALHGERQFDVATARAVAGLGTLGEWCLPLVREGGLFAVLKGRSAEEELEAGGAELVAAGAVDPQVRELGVGLVPEPARAVVATVRHATPVPSVAGPGTAGPHLRRSQRSTPDGRRRNRRSR